MTNHSPESLMEAVQRLELTVYGNPSEDKAGLVEKTNANVKYIEEIRGDLRKIIWLLLAGVIGAGLNLVLNAKNTVAQQHNGAAVTQPK